MSKNRINQTEKRLNCINKNREYWEDRVLKKEFSNKDDVLFLLNAPADIDFLLKTIKSMIQKERD